MNKANIPYETLNLMCKDLKYIELFPDVKIPDSVSQEERAIIIEIQKISSICIRIDKTETLFFPHIQFSNGSSFAIEHIGQKEEDILHSIEYDKLPIKVACHLSDILFKHESTIINGKRTIDYYLTIATAQDESVNISDCFYRCLQIYKQLKLSKEKRKTILNTAYNLSVEKNIDTSDKLDLWALLLEQNFGDKKIIISSLLSIIEKEPGENTYDLLLKYLKKHDKQEYKKYLEIYINYLISFATSYETNNIDSIWQSINKLEKAYDLSSADDKKKAILLQIQKLQQMSNNYLGKTNIDISKEVNEFSNCFNNLIKDKDFQSSIEIALLFASPVSIKELKKEIHTSLKKNPLHLLCPTKILDNNGSVQATIPPLEISSTEDNIPNEEIILHMAEKQKYKGILIGNSLSIIQSKFNFTINDLEFIVKDNPVIPPKRENIFLQGIYHFLKGDIYLALHILIPQTENLFRNILFLSGEPIIYRDSIHETYNYHTLSDMLKPGKLNEIMEEDFILNVSCMLTNRIGANFRNIIAHGLLDKESAFDPISVYILSFFIRFILLNRK